MRLAIASTKFSTCKSNLSPAKFSPKFLKFQVWIPVSYWLFPLFVTLPILAFVGFLIRNQPLNLAELTLKYQEDRSGMWNGMEVN